MPFAGKLGTCRGTLGYSRRKHGCQEAAAWQVWAGMCGCWASQAEGGKVECMGRRALAGGMGLACTRGAGEGTAPRQHRGGGVYLWGRGWDSQRQDSDRMGQSLGPCLLRLIPVLRPPHRGLLATACPEPGSALVRAGAELSRGLMPSWEGRGAPAIVLQLWVRGAPEEGGNTSKHCHPPHSEGTHRGHGHLPPALAQSL